MWWRVSSGQVPIRIVSGAAPDFDGVVGDQPVAADDQVERALALADAALAGDQDAEAEDVHQHGVHASSARRGESSRIELSLAIAVGVATEVFSSGSRARSASSDELRGRRRTRR